MPPRKLAMNEGDNEYLVASRFIEENELPPYFAEQVRRIWWPMWLSDYGNSCSVCMCAVTLCTVALCAACHCVLARNRSCP